MTAPTTPSATIRCNLGRPLVPTEEPLPTFRFLNLQPTEV
jgi:hypothetical protein